MTRMTVTLDEELLAEARRLSGARTKREALETALREFVVRMRRSRVASHAGTLELTLTHERLRRWRDER
ncbi:MAG: hypothetical protein A2Z07_00500 [Armatimonadetes bacterium RBG_16_67_12]|nr:MAG: hypothetical protein A2Z07_00500 [Armatimonadetes bacterium RBG_16_67_12]